MSLKRLCLLFIALIFTSPVFAIFCPKSFNSVNMGDSINVVLQVCGAPDAQRTYTPTAPAVEEWNYFIRPRFGGNEMSKITFLVKDNRVLNISIPSGPPGNGTGPLPLNGPGNGFFAQQQYGRNVSNTSLCGTPIYVGDSSDKVKSVCGEPGFIKSFPQPTPTNGNGNQVTEFTYYSNPPVTFVFQNGVLSNRK